MTVLPAEEPPDYPPEPRSASVARIERAQLCDLFARLGPAAPTLDEGWTTHHLAAHLVLREGNPVGMLLASRPRLGDRAVERMVARRPFADLVGRLRSGPPALSPYAIGAVDRLLNSLEYLIHHEDVRRAASGWQPRDLPRWVDDRVWAQARWVARGSLRGSPVGVVVRRSDTGSREFLVKRLDPVELVGDPVELTLFCSGRERVARLEVEGRPADVARFRTWRDG